MFLLLAALLLAPAQDEVEKARDAMNKALTALDRFYVDRSCATLVKLNDERTTDFFIGSFRAGLLQIAELEKERLKIVKEMEKVEVTRDKEGKILKGDNNKWTLLKHDHDILAGKIDILNG